jgi:hypothetical protein
MEWSERPMESHCRVRPMCRSVTVQVCEAGRGRSLIATS